jgi:hypothetical protein
LSLREIGITALAGVMVCFTRIGFRHYRSPCEHRGIYAVVCCPQIAPPIEERPREAYTAFIILP